MEENDQPAEVRLPVGMAAIACIVCFAFVFGATKSAVVRLGVWWVELLIYALIPIAVSFVILYRSHWHLEMARVARTSRLILLSCLIFCSEFLFFALLITAMCIFVGLGRGHG